MRIDDPDGGNGGCTNVTCLPEPSEPDPPIPPSEGGNNDNHGNDDQVEDLNDILAPSLSSYPSVITLHPLDGNGVSQVPIYDYSYNPPRLIGYRIISYAYDDVHANGANYFLPSDTITWTTFLWTRTRPLLQPSIENLSSIGVSISCTACGITLTVLSTVDSLNSAITIDAHIRTHDIYISEPPIVTPLDQSPFP